MLVLGVIYCIIYILMLGFMSWIDDFSIVLRFVCINEMVKIKKKNKSKINIGYILRSIMNLVSKNIFDILNKI